MEMIHIVVEILAALAALATTLRFALDEWRKRRCKRDGSGERKSRE